MRRDVIGTEQIFKNLIQEIIIKIKEDLSPYFGRIHRVSWKADPECRVTNPLILSILGMKVGMEVERKKKKKEMTTYSCKHTLNLLTMFIRENIVEKMPITGL